MAKKAKVKLVKFQVKETAPPGDAKSETPTYLHFDPSKTPLINTTLQTRANERYLEILAKGSNADVYLKVGPFETVMMAHRLILTTASEFFANALSGDWAESKNNEIKLDHIKPKVMRVVLQYIYGGIVKMSQDFEETLAIYDAFKFLCLTEPCAVIRTSIACTLHSHAGEALQKYWWQIQACTYPELFELGLQVFGRLLREACEGLVDSNMVDTVASVVETAEDGVKVLKYAWGSQYKSDSLYADPVQHKSHCYLSGEAHEYAPCACDRPTPTLVTFRGIPEPTYCPCGIRYEPKSQKPASTTYSNADPYNRPTSPGYSPYQPSYYGPTCDHTPQHPGTNSSNQYEKHAAFYGHMFAKAWAKGRKGGTRHEKDLLLRGVSEICGFGL
ncbi:hypothetical protein HK097_007814 [Rhizophlyctis rosea]|uniref:BTB domain-containing protein n=1 Tax=Rhizophlyctis rosea TaxID=64517 RepID=A0AAD5SCP8_9FUNG|nr:hypothetical protein HK097_007814 [Rhizophlyctis rosea]